MKKTLGIGCMIILWTLLVAIPTKSHAAQGVLGMEPDEPVAILNGEAIKAVEMFSALAESHGNMGKEIEAGKINYSAILDRIINMRLLIQEARNIGFDELPEHRSSMEAFREQTLVSMLLSNRLNVIKVDEAEVEKQYGQQLVEWKMTAFLFKKKEDAEAVAKDVKKGKSLEAAAEHYVVDGRAEKEDIKGYAKEKDLLPEVLASVSSLKKGETGPVIQIQAGFVVLRVDDKRSYEDADARQQISEEILAGQKKRGRDDFYKELVKKYVTIDKGVLDSVTYDSPEAFEKSLEDDRVVARIQDEAPITVGELSESVKKRFFHGIDSEDTLRRANQTKYDVIEGMLQKRVFMKEALATGIDKKDEFRFAMQEYEHTLLFGYFLRKVVLPDVKVEDKDLNEYYEKNIQDYTYPEMMRIQSLAFDKRSDAEKAMEQLNEGTDFKWVKANSEGQVSADREGLLHFKGTPLITRDLPEGMRKMVSGAQAGSYRLYESPEPFYYVLFIESVNPSSPQPFESVKELVRDKVFNKKAAESVDKWIGQLRKASDIKVLIEL